MALYRSPEYHSTQGEYDLIRGTFLRNNFESGHRPRRCCFSIFSSGGHFVQQSGTILATSGKGVLKEHFCEIILTSGRGLGGDVV